MKLKPEDIEGNVRKFESAATFVRQTDAHVGWRYLTEITMERIDWLWPTRFARGKLSLIAGFPGDGKSQITISIASIVTNGGTWPGSKDRCEPGKVIFLSAEDGAGDTLKPRLVAAGAAVDRCAVFETVMRAENGREVAHVFDIGRDIGALDRVVNEMERDGGKVALVVIDPLNAYLGEGIDAHKDASIRRALTPIAEFAERRHIAVIGVTHFNKGTQSKAMLRITGSIATPATSRAAYVVARDPKNSERLLFLPAKNNLAPMKDGLAYTIEPRTVPSIDGDDIGTSVVVWDRNLVNITADDVLAPTVQNQSAAQLNDAALFLSDVLAEGPLPGREVKKLAEANGHAWATVHRARARYGFKIERSGYGKEHVSLWSRAD